MLVRGIRTQANRLISSFLATVSDISEDTDATADIHVFDNTKRSLIADGKPIQNPLCKTTPNYAKIILCRTILKSILVMFTAVLHDHLQNVTSIMYDYAIIVKAQKTCTSEHVVDYSQCIAQSSITKRPFTTSTAQCSHVRQITMAMYDCAAATDVELLDTAKGNL